jgi:hypothetical protein
MISYSNAFDTINKHQRVITEANADTSKTTFQLVRANLVGREQPSSFCDKGKAVIAEPHYSCMRLFSPSLSSHSTENLKTIAAASPAAGPKSASLRLATKVTSLTDEVGGV